MGSGYTSWPWLIGGNHSLHAVCRTVCCMRWAWFTTKRSHGVKLSMGVLEDDRLTASMRSRVMKLVAFYTVIGLALLSFSEVRNKTGVRFSESYRRQILNYVLKGEGLVWVYTSPRILRACFLLGLLIGTNYPCDHPVPVHHTSPTWQRR